VCGGSLSAFAEGDKKVLVASASAMRSRLRGRGGNRSAGASLLGSRRLTGTTSRGEKYEQHRQFGVHPALLLLLETRAGERLGSRRKFFW